PIPSSRCAFALLASIAQVPIRAIPAGLNLLAAVDGRSIACQYFARRDQKDTAFCADSHFGFVPVRLIAPCLHECGHSAIIKDGHYAVPDEEAGSWNRNCSLTSHGRSWKPISAFPFPKLFFGQRRGCNAHSEQVGTGARWGES